MTACTRPYELTVDGDVRRQSVVTVDVVQWSSAARCVGVCVADW